MMQAVFLFPGQGSQQLGMCRDFWGTECASALAAQARSIVGQDLLQVIEKGPIKALTATQVLQPAITLMNAICLAEVTAVGAVPVAVAGHSLGELSACYAARMFPFQALMKLAAGRGALMAAAAHRNEGAMVAVTSDQPSTVGNLIAKMQGEGAAIYIANINSPGQVVVSGATAAVADFQTRAGKAGLRRIVRLQVSGAWHSAFMKDCEASFAELIGQQPIKDPAIPVFSNVGAQPATTRAEITTALIDQLSAPVLWLQTLKRLRETYPDAVFAEIGPGKILTGLMLETDPRAKIFQINSRRGLERFAEAIG